MSANIQNFDEIVSDTERNLLSPEPDPVSEKGMFYYYFICRYN